jgi:hypothetical protein
MFLNAATSYAVDLTHLTSVSCAIAKSFVAYISLIWGIYSFLEQWSDFLNQLLVRFNTPTHFSAMTRFLKSVISLILHSYQVIESNCQIFYINNQVDLIYPLDFLWADIF